MQRCSSSIGTLAAALAKAQGELVNPEKSLVATIRADGRGGGERTFRYAPLSSGLDIVRKILGQHEIATVQTTSMDPAAGIINLTTVLAHASGEWIASDWPVCAISDTATPHRMGAALTYARRYALFTLVGIAGEDDLDAPDLVTPTNPASQPEKPQPSGKGQLNGSQPRPAQRPTVHRNARTQSQISKPILEAEPSAGLRDRLIAELTGLGSSDDAATWAHRCLGEKNRLTAADARKVEEAFQARVATFAGRVADAEPSVLADSKQPGTMAGPSTGDPYSRRQAKAVDKSALALPAPRRIRDRDHVKFVAQNPCLICGRQPADAHHLRFAQSRALGRKVSDEFTVPLCRGHHREVHRYGNEAAWWAKVEVDPIASARALWLKTHPLLEGSEKTGNKSSIVSDEIHNDGNAALS